MRSDGLAVLAARCAPPLAAGVAVALLAAFQADRAAAAETAYLALWIVAVLLPAAALAPTPAWEVTLGTALPAFAAWALPAGPARGAVIGALLVAIFARATVRAAAARRGSAPDRGAGTAGSDWTGAMLPLALGAQILLRGELLLAPGTAEVATLVGLPAVGALALARLAERCGPAAALLAGAGALTLGPGWTAATTLALVGVAAGAELGARLTRRSLPLMALAAVLAVGLATETRAAAAAVAAGAIVASLDLERRESRRRSVGVALGLLAAAVVAGGAVAALRPWREALGLASWLLIALPALVWLPALPARRWGAAAAAVALAAAGALAVPGPAAPAAAVAVLAVLVAGGPRAVLAAQGVWSGALLAGTAALASYPWLRSAPAAEALGFVGLAPGWTAALLLAGLALAIGAVALLAGRAPRRRRRVGPALWTAGLLAVGLLATLPAPARQPFTGPPAELGPGRPRLAIELEGSAVGVAVVYSHLSNGAGLPAGTEVAEVRLVDVAAETPAVWTLEAGTGTGEWAARRSDVAARSGLAVPPPWLAWVAGGSDGGGADGGVGGGAYFAQSYRDVLTAGSAAPAVTLEIERSTDLPSEVLLTVHRVEVGP